MAYIDNIYGNTLWLAVWEPAGKEFHFQQVFDFASIGSSIPLNISYSDKGDRLYVTTGIPGHLNIFDISKNPQNPTLLKSIPTAGGAHHVAVTKDNRLAFVQNNLLNIPGMSDGSITVIDMMKGEALTSIDTLKNQGMNPNCIILLPEWSKGHMH
jgi:DNA-binding beta-propeller fold protein YncE